MEHLALILSVLGIHAFAWLTPGPLFILIIRNSLAYSNALGIWTAVGIALGNLIHVSYSVAALALLFSFSETLSTIIGFVGVLYLFYLGFRVFTTKEVGNTSHTEEPNTHLKKFDAFKMGFLVNITSPQASLFFASIFAAVFSTNAPVWVIAFLMIAMPLLSLIMASLLSFFFSTNVVKSFYSKRKTFFNRALGVFLFIFAVLALSYLFQG